MLLLIGLGVGDARDISLRGLEAARKADKVYVELYTSKFSSSVEEIAEIIGREVEVLSRSDLEENCWKIVEEARDRDVAVLIPGDPMVATTHVILRLEARKRGVESRVIHSSSVVSAVCGATGLQVYRFGKVATVSWTKSRAPIDVLKANESIDAHTLLLLDVDMSVSDAVEILVETDGSLAEKFAVGVARIGWEPVLACDRLAKLTGYEFGDLPHCIVVLAPTLHIVEYEYLSAFANAPKELEVLVR
ncbi:MAG: diphthine synthase [Archaeoglobaceae archaeon]